MNNTNNLYTFSTEDNRKLSSDIKILEINFDISDFNNEYTNLKDIVKSGNVNSMSRRENFNQNDFNRAAEVYDATR